MVGSLAARYDSIAHQLLQACSKLEGSAPMHENGGAGLKHTLHTPPPIDILSSMGTPVAIGNKSTNQRKQIYPHLWNFYPPNVALTTCGCYTYVYADDQLLGISIFKGVKRPMSPSPTRATLKAHYHHTITPTNKHSISTLPFLLAQSVDSYGAKLSTTSLAVGRSRTI